MDEVIIRELGGGASAVLVAMLFMALGVLALVIRTLWSEIQKERLRTIEVQSACIRDTRELQLSTLKTLNEVDKTLTSLVAGSSNSRRREDDR